VHNHPSGDPAPSHDDKQITDQLGLSKVDRRLTSIAS
jgi:DNA repair protein RadC